MCCWAARRHGMVRFDMFPGFSGLLKCMISGTGATQCAVLHTASQEDKLGCSNPQPAQACGPQAALCGLSPVIKRPCHNCRPALFSMPAIVSNAGQQGCHVPPSTVLVQGMSRPKARSSPAVIHACQKHQLAGLITDRP